MGGRKAIGCGPIAACRLGRVWWNLDLREGIDFSIFVFGGIEREMSPARRPAGFSERPHRLIYRAQEAEFFWYLLSPVRCVLRVEVFGGEPSFQLNFRLPSLN